MSSEVWYQCQRCTNCCRWPGEVKLLDSDIAKIAAFLGLSEWEFVQRYTTLQASRRGLTLTEQEDGACVFLKGRDCAIQPVKPEQCRGFPNKWNFPGWRAVCEAVEVPKEKSVEGEAEGLEDSDLLMRSCSKGKSME